MDETLIRRDLTYTPPDPDEKARKGRPAGVYVLEPEGLYIPENALHRAKYGECEAAGSSLVVVRVEGAPVGGSLLAALREFLSRCEADIVISDLGDGLGTGPWVRVPLSREDLVSMLESRFFQLHPKGRIKNLSWPEDDNAF